MPNIKVKEKSDRTIKIFDKSYYAFDKTKDNLVNINDNNDINQIDYGSKKINEYSNKAAHKSVEEGKKALVKSKEKVKDIKNKPREIKNNVHKQIKIVKKAYKKTKRAVKTTAKVSYKAAKTTVKATKKAIIVTKKIVVAIVKAIIAIMKAIIQAAASLISALVAGGWVAVVIVVILCVIALIVGSIFGIFFSGEDDESPITLNGTIAELNKELTDKIDTIKGDNEHDEYEISFDRTEWKYILSVYVAKTSKGDNDMEFFTMDEDKKKSLKEVFWDMTNIDSEVKGDETKTLYIYVKGKSLDDMIKEYNFNDEQKEQIEELLSEDFEDLWASAIYGIPSGSLDMVQVALSQVGNVGGEPYWSWYGFNERVEWCAIFVSWVASQMGYIEAGVIPKFSVCLEGVNWFKAKGEWKDKGYIPNSGDIIFFDWEDDGEVNHVGIVEKVENNTIYTIEGNSTDDTCLERQYSINSKVIFGFGTPAYS